MFTGLVSDVGEIVAVAASAAGARYSIACGYAKGSIPLGASIACSGPCLTVVDIESGADGRTVFSIDASPETLGRTTMADWKVGTRINLERSLKAGDELGGHLVTGHIDGLAEITRRVDQGGSVRFDFKAPRAVSRFIAEKGSISLDGTSLTVNGVDCDSFWVTLIPHTLAVTTWGERDTGNRVNLEVDLLARYVARLAETVNA